MTTAETILPCINVRLCGALSRDDCKRLGDVGARSALAVIPTSRSNTSDPTDRTTLTYSDLLEIIPSPAMENTPLVPLLEPPTWAVPARGEAKLEPIGEYVGRQACVDLTRKPSFRIGRSPNCDVQLHHATSSRRHAILFHHANGTCYVVDCGSAHGTYVNGVRVSSPQANGQIIPFRVRRGALIRFGGPGAPAFVLKSFQTNLDLIQEPEAEVVRRNTRINALGSSSEEYMRRNLSCTITKVLDVCRKRSFDSLDSSATLGFVEPMSDDSVDQEMKRSRCSSPTFVLTDEVPIRLVSPDVPAMILMSGFCGRGRRRVHFSPDPPLLHYPNATPDVA